MTELLYMSYESKLSKDNELTIDKKVSINWRQVHTVVKNLASTVSLKRDKTTFIRYRELPVYAYVDMSNRNNVE